VYFKDFHYANFIEASNKEVQILLLLQKELKTVLEAGRGRCDVTLLPFLRA
jgi:hypothetical protein